MKNILLFSALFIFTFGFSQTTLIPDPNFEQALIDLGYDTAPIDGSVPTANISSITDLDVNTKNIVDLTGIEDFTALTDLNCRYNQLTTLDVNNNTDLTYLHCGDNLQLASLDVSNNISLTSLQCYNNQLTNLDLTNNVALNNLGCSGNQLTSLDLSANTALDYLLCFGNQLTSLDLSANTAITQLVCSYNPLGTLDISMLNNLVLLYTDYTQLTTLDVSNNIELSALQCYGNQLTNLDVSQNILLWRINCNDNQLTTLDITQNIALTYLDCFNNQLTSLDVRNGNNINFTLFNTTNNPDLTCIFVDNPDYSSDFWFDVDPASTFVENEAECEALSIGEYAFELDVTIYPNPTDNYLFIEGNKNPISISIYNLLGAEVITKSTTNKINVSELPKGIYIIKISDGIGQTDRKFIKN